MKLEKTVCSIVPKKWGEERIIYNGTEYCGKILKFNKGTEFSTHFHLKKQETWLIKGHLKLIYINTEDASKHEIELKDNDVITIWRLTPHKLIALEESEVIEVSTTHFDSDSYRVEPGDSQKTT